MRSFKASEAVDVDGEEYTLAIDIAVIDAIEDDFDCSFDEIMAKIGSGSVRIGRMTRLVRGLLSREHPELSLDEVASLLFSNGDAFAEAMERLFTKAWPDKVQEAKGENPPKSRPGTGARSFQRGVKRV